MDRMFVHGGRAVLTFPEVREEDVAVMVEESK